MSYTWTVEGTGKDRNYRVPGRAFVGVSWKGWYHISLYLAAEDRWAREPGVYATAEEAKEWAELLLEEQDIITGQTPQPFTVHFSVTVQARTAEEAVEIARRMSLADLTPAAAPADLEMVG